MTSKATNRPTFSAAAMAIALGLTISGASREYSLTAAVEPAINRAAGGELESKDEMRPQIHMAILLDTSSSMSGLIHQARTQLWKVVNEFATTTLGGQRPQLQVALYEYGKNSLPEKDGFTRLVVPLTSDLDRISEQLFTLAQARPGSSERCGQVIDRAVRDLRWSTNKKDLLCIFIAGNEPFTQGPVDFRKACRAAAERGITVSTIYCGPIDVGRSTMWAEGAKLADGSYMSIDHNQVVADIKAPQDEELAKLNAELNKTYVPYGDDKHRDAAQRRQLAQDANAENSDRESAAARAAFKSSALYDNARWDLVDAYRRRNVKLEDLREDQLPDELRKLKPEDRRKYIEEKAKARSAIQAKIKAISAHRDEFIATERRKLHPGHDRTLGAVLSEAVREQAKAKDFQVDGQENTPRLPEP